MYAVGLDTSLTGTGLAAVEIDYEQEWMVAELGSSGHRGDNINARYQRLSGLRDRIVGAFEHLPGGVSLAGIEGPSYSSKFGSPWDRGGLWWMVVSALRERGIPVALVAPQGRAKYATGSGGANKNAVKAAAINTYRAPAIKSDNVADAVVIAAMMARGLGRPVDSLPEKNLEAMLGVEWPWGDE